MNCEDKKGLIKFGPFSFLFAYINIIYYLCAIKNKISMERLTFEELFSDWLKANDYDHYSLDYEDGRYMALLNCIPSELNADEYNKVTDILDSATIKRANYEIYFAYDSSGYDYWHRFDDECNWIGITVQATEKNAIFYALDILDDIESMIDEVNKKLFFANNIAPFL